MIKDVLSIALFITLGYFGYQHYLSIKDAEEIEVTPRTEAQKTLSRVSDMQEKMDAFANSSVKTQDGTEVFSKMGRLSENKSAVRQSTVDRLAKLEKDPLVGQVSPDNDIDETMCKSAERRLERLKDNMPKDFNNKSATQKHFQRVSKAMEKVDQYCGKKPYRNF